MSECVQTEALTHQTMPWTGAGERRTVFFKYSPKALTWSSVSFLPLPLLFKQINSLVANLGSGLTALLGGC